MPDPVVIPPLEERIYAYLRHSLGLVGPLEDHEERTLRRLAGSDWDIATGVGHLFLLHGEHVRADLDRSWRRAVDLFFAGRRHG